MERPSWIGQTLGGRYRIDEIVGQGGMSAVYKAMDPNLKRVVAVKMIHPHLSEDPKFLMRFEEEAKAVAQLRHPNIVQVYDFNHDDHVYYMVQEFVPGETLQARLRRLNKAGRRMPLKEAIQFTLDICSAVSYAHQRGMVHRDIKPANIMLDVQGQAILMDFGIVKIMGGEKHTATGAVIGTAMYMSPELIRGEPPDERSDLYSLGVTLFEMVSGRPPFEAESAMTLMMMHLNDPLPDLRELRPEVPEDLIAVIRRALAKERDGRYRSANEMAADLNKVLERIEGGIPYDATLVDGQTPEAGSPTLPDATLVEPPAVSPSGARQPTSNPSGSMSGTMPAHPAAGSSSQTASPPVTPPHAPQASGGGQRQIGGRSFPPAVLYGGGIALALILLFGGIFMGSRLFGGDDTPPAVALATETGAPVLAPTETSAPTDTPEPTATSAPTATQAPTATEAPLEIILPTPTIPAGVPYVRINGISLDERERYVVEYETFQYTEELPGMHVHFFFNTVPPEQAGSPGNGPWKLYGGPRPFDEYRAVDRPENAFLMCSLVANANHSVQPESGTCWRLPDVPVLTALLDMPCRQAPESGSPEMASLKPGDRAMVRGISTNEQWWYVMYNDNPDDSCWVSDAYTRIDGDISEVEVVQPASSGAPYTSLYVEITGITIDSQNRYVVNYVTYNYTEELPGTHVHFFFDTVPPDQAGSPGNGPWKLYGGPRPFTEYRVSDRPANAQRMCALVANPNHTVQAQSGNCWDLP